MKSVKGIFLVTLTCTLAIFIPMAFKRPVPDKAYPISKSLNEWSADIDTLTVIQLHIGYPMSKQDGDYYQAAMARLINRLRTPLILQIQEEQKKDSVKPKK